MTAASCRDVVDQLPWLVNQSLPDSQAERLREHLRDCEPCSQELVRTHEVWDLATGHLPLDALLDYAFLSAEAFVPAEALDPAATDAGESEPAEAVAGGSRLTSAQLRLIEDHLEICETCSEEVRLVRSTRAGGIAGVEAELEALPFEPARSEAPKLASQVRRWRRLALAASLTAAICAGGWLWTWSSRVSTTPDVPGWRVNLPIVELVPNEAAGQATGQAADSLRGEDASRVNVLQPRADRPTSVLVLLSTDPPAQDLQLDVVDAEEGLLWRVEGLRRTEDGLVSIVVPNRDLPAGDYELRLRGAETIRVYALRVEPPRR